MHAVDRRRTGRCGRTCCCMQKVAGGKRTGYRGYSPARAPMEWPRSGRVNRRRDRRQLCAPWNAMIRDRCGSRLGGGRHAGAGASGSLRPRIRRRDGEIDCEAAGVLDLRPGRCRALDSARISRCSISFQPSTPDERGIYFATWTGISGDTLLPQRRRRGLHDVTNEWLDANIRSKGPLGKIYPRFMFIMEGDTPSFLGLIDNGLNAYRRPDWGGWGGRYVYRQPYGETHPIWTQGGDEFPRVDSQDTVWAWMGRAFSIRRRSGAGARHSRTTLRRAWTGRSRILRMPTTTLRWW